MRSRRETLLSLAALTALIISAHASVAYAHALLERSEPAAGTVAPADTAPTQVSLWFSEPVSVEFNSFTILDADNRRVDNFDARVASSDPTRVSSRPQSQRRHEHIPTARRA